MKRYPKYKDSGVEWLVEIPEHWDLLPLKRFITINRQTLNEDTSPEYEIEYIDIGNVDERGIIDVLQKMKFENAPSRARRVVKQNDTIISTVRTYLKAITFISENKNNLIASTGFAVLTPKKNTFPKYLTYLISSHFFVNQISADSKGVNYPAITSVELGRLKIAVTNLIEEQKTIARFLDRKLEQIGHFISNKQRLIELLKEQKTAIANRAVTKGLNPHAPMKPSDIQWLAEIPAHWKILPLKHIAKIQTGVTLGKSYTDVTLETRPYLRVANVQDGYLDLSDIKNIELPKSEVNRYILKVNDVLMTEGGDFDKLGRGYVWEGQIQDCLHQNHIFAVRPDLSCLKSYFLAVLMKSSYGRNYFIFTSKQTTNLASTNSTTLKNLKIILPSVDEQTEILNFIEEESAKIDFAIAKIEKEIELIQEYRTTLISDAVTGKIDVRETSAV